MSLTAGGVIKCVLTTVLVSMPALNIKGAPIATCVCYVVMIAMNLIFLRPYMKGCARSILVNVAKTAAAAILMGGAAYLLAIPLESALGLKLGGMLAIVLAAAVYAVLIFVFKVVTVDELKSIRRRG